MRIERGTAILTLLLSVVTGGGVFAVASSSKATVPPNSRPAWAQSPKAAAAFDIFSFLLGNELEYRTGITLIVTGLVCTNLETINGTSMGNFICPVDGYTAHDAYCCGESDRQYCCRVTDEPLRGGGIYGIAILIFAILLFACIVCFVACREKRKLKKMKKEEKNRKKEEEKELEKRRGSTCSSNRVDESKEKCLSRPMSARSNVVHPMPPLPAGAFNASVSSMLPPFTDQAPPPMPMKSADPSMDPPYPTPMASSSFGYPSEPYPPQHVVQMAPPPYSRLAPVSTLPSLPPLPPPISLPPLSPHTALPALKPPPQAPSAPPYETNSMHTSQAEQSSVLIDFSGLPPPPPTYFIPQDSSLTQVHS